MRKLIFAAMATAILSASMTLVVRADDTTVIKRGQRRRSKHDGC